MADVNVKQQDPHEDQEVNERTDTKAEERDDNRQTKPEEKEEPLATQQKEEPQATQQKEEPPATKQEDEPPATKQREERPATKQREERPATKQREEPPATRDGDRGGDNQSGSEMTKGHAQQQQSEGTKNSQEDNTKGTDNTPTKGTQKTNQTGESPTRRDNDNHNQKNTKSVSKGGSTKEGTKTSPKSQKTTPQKDAGKKDTKGSSDRKQEEGVKGSESKKKGNKGENAEKEKKEHDRDENSGTGTGKDTSRSSYAELSEGRSKQKEFFKLELQRLEGSLKRESSKIVAPSKKPHTPYIFNTLEPYYNTQITRYLIELPDEMKHGHTSRRTAQGLTDPWVDLRMDRDILPKVPSKPVSRQVAILKREKEIRDRKKRSAVSQSSNSRKGGSTRLPKFPVVSLETQDLASKPLYYSDVPFLRSELKSKYSSSARSKIDEDYKRTQQDFFRMELDKLDQVHPVNRRHMRSAYFAYLQNTPGSKKAITDCVRGLESGKAQ